MFGTLNNLFRYGETVREHKYQFLRNLGELYFSEKSREQKFAGRLQKQSNQRLLGNIFKSWRSSFSTPNVELQKAEIFYSQNMKIKGFFALVKYARKMKELKQKRQEEEQEVNNFALNRFFKRWQRAFTHRMNMLGNRKCFKVKFSDYCRCKKCVAAQMEIDIRPEFDKFTTNPYPRLSSAMNSSRVEEDPSHLIKVNTSGHPFNKFFNPMERAYLKPTEEQIKDGSRTDCTIRTFNENENSFNPFNKCGIRETFDMTIPGSENNQNMIRSYDSDNIKNITQPYRNTLQSRENTQKNIGKHSYLQTERMSQNMHPNQTGRHTLSVETSTLNQSNVKSNSKENTIPKSTKNKAGSIRFCSSKKKQKKSNSRGRKMVKPVQSNQISTRFGGNKLIQSTSSLPQSLNYYGSKAEDVKLRENLNTSHETNRLLAKYENTNLKAKTTGNWDNSRFNTGAYDNSLNKSEVNNVTLTDQEKKDLTQKAMLTIRSESESKPPYTYSASPNSLEISSRIEPRFLPEHRPGTNLQSNATEPCYINLINEEASMGRVVHPAEPVTRVTINDHCLGSKRSNNQTTSRSKSNKKKNIGRKGTKKAVKKVR